MTQQVFQQNQIKELKKKIDERGAQRVFLVHGKGSYVKSGAEAFIKQLFGSETPTSFSDFENNPQLGDLEKGLALFKQGNYKLIIAIGGGSVLDMAKLISVFAHQQNPPKDIVLGKAKIEPINTPLLAIPTTAGTGAEATKFAVLYIDKTKYSVESKAMLPESVYLSSAFTQSASKYLTACTGLDAFCQAVESVWSVNATDESMHDALKAAEIIWNHLPKAVHENDSISKTLMQDAAYLAGRAINITKTTAPHALSYAFTSYYNIPHGHAVALSLPFFLNYNLQVTPNDCTDKRGPQAVKKRIGKLLMVLELNANEAEKKISVFIESLGVKLNISALTNSFDPAIIMDNVNFNRLKNNPREVTPQSIQNFINQSLK